METETKPTFNLESLEKSEHQHQKITDASGISDEAVLIFTWTVYGVVCQVIDIFGIVTNIVTIICFLKQDSKDSVNISLLGLAVSDLGSLITLVGVNVMYSLSVTAADLTFEPIEVSYFIFTLPHMSFTRVSSWITAVITLERCLCIITPLKIKSFLTPKKMIIIIAAVFIILQITVVPLYAASKLGLKFYLLKNKTLLGRISVGDGENIDSIFYIINNFIIPVPAFAIIVICTVILVVKLQKQTQWIKTSAAPAQTDRISSRNQKVAKMVVMISTLFIVCFAPFCIIVLVVALEPELLFGGKYLKIAIIFLGLCLLLESVNSSMNIFIYYHMSSKYRETFRDMFRLHT